MATETRQRLAFASDYQHGAHPAIVEKLVITNMDSSSGYGTDSHCERARELIRAACDAPEADVYFLAGGTQANAVTIGALLSPWQGVIAADTGHISAHEGGAIEAGGHKVLTVPGKRGKLSAASVDAFASTWEADENRDHMVMPGLVYISQPTEYGTLYTLSELEALHETCVAHNLKLYVDGARLAYALGAPSNDVTLADLARLTDAFYIGGTKCGTLLGEAMVFPKPNTCPHFFTVMKQHGAVLAKGRVLGIQFESLFEDGLYFRIGKDAVAQAFELAQMLEDTGCALTLRPETNQVFVALTKEQEASLAKDVDMSFWENTPDGRVVVRLATSWATTDEDVATLKALLERWK